MKKKLLISCLVILSLIFVMPLIFGCMSTGARYTAGISIDINTDKLNEFCEINQCFEKQNNIIIKSDYGSNVLIVLGDFDSILGFEGVALVLPYFIDKTTYEIHYNYIDPQEFELERALKTDLQKLVDNEIISLSNEKIDKISNEANFANVVRICRGEWMSLPENCFCQEEGDIICANVKCGAASIDFSEFIDGENIETPSNSIYWIIGIAAVIILIILFLILRKRS